MFARHNPGLRLVALALLAAGFILYGSLYPFRFQALPEEARLPDALASALARAPSSRGDVFANLLLYMPLGLLAAVTLARQPAWARVALPAFAGALLSLMVEIVQVYVPGRTSSGWDVLCNAVGTGLGAALTLLGAGRVVGRRPRILEPVPALLVLAWMAYALFPYLPTLDLQVWRDNLKPLLLHPVLEPARTLRLLVTWTAAALMTEAAIGRELARRAVPPGLAAALIAEVVMPGQRLDLAEATALGLTPLFWVVLRGQAWAAPLMAAGLLVMVLVERLEPFVFTATPPRDFGWIPFRSLVQGSMEAGFLAILSKLFLQGATLWWLLRAGMRAPAAVGLQATLVFAGSLAQTHIPGRSAEITDTLLVIGLALAFRTVRPAVASSRATAGWRSRAARRLVGRSVSRSGTRRAYPEAATLRADPDAAE
jgi:VanZ family protein